jgi:restriction system protein
VDDYDSLMKPVFARFGNLDSSCGSVEEVSPAQQFSQILSAQNHEVQNQIAELHKLVMQSLQEQLLAHIYVQTPGFFENLIIDLLLVMGYGTRRRDLSRRLGKSHDGGIDGIISQDELGLEVILVQAKRLKPNSTVSVAHVRDFIGSLEARRASKGIFVTTGNFTLPARMVVQDISRRVVLINGSELAALMVRHNLGVKISESYVFKTFDKSYFTAVRP